MLLKIVYLLTCRVLGLAVVLFRGDRAKDAELLVLRHENAVLRRHASRVQYEPADRMWLAALARLIPRNRWTEVCPGTPGTLLAWHRKLSNFTASFDADFQASGTRILRTAVQAPRMNAICERLAGTLHGELLDRVLIISEQHLRAVLTEYQSHYNTARPHQGIAQRVPDDEPDDPRLIGTDLDIRQIRRRPALNGLINEYTHAA